MSYKIIDIVENNNECLNDFCLENFLTLIDYDLKEFNFKCSRLFSYYNDEKNNDIISVINNIKKNGICDNNLWSYNIENINIKPPDICYEYANSSYHSIIFYNINNDLSTLKKTLDKNKPILVSLISYNNVIIYGYDDRDQKFLIKTNNNIKHKISYKYLLKNYHTSDFWCIKSRYYNVNIQKKDKILLDKIEIIENNDINYIDLRNNFTVNYNQGNLESCTANAICSIFNYYDNNFLGSRLFLYYNERILQNSINTDSGAKLEDGINAILIYGLCDENEWIYDITKFKIQPPIICYINGIKNKNIKYLCLDNTIENIKKCLIDKTPVYIGIAIYESFEDISVYNTGIIKMPDPNEKYLGGHAVVICGFNDDKNIFICKNSWGNKWGDNGYFYIPYEYIINEYLASDIYLIKKND